MLPDCCQRNGNALIAWEPSFYCFRRSSGPYRCKPKPQQLAVGRVRGVRCILPVSQSQHLPVELGMRHRAALGLSEVTDALVWVVSEETGTISLAHEGELRRALHPNDCREIMHELLNPKQG